MLFPDLVPFPIQSSLHAPILLIRCSSLQPPILLIALLLSRSHLTALYAHLLPGSLDSPKSYALSSFGIATQGYFSSGENEKGVYHIDGDSDDSVSSGNDDKLRAAIASDPETVVSFFSQLATKLYTDLGNKMATSSVSSAYTVYNDKQMTKQYSEYTTKISDAETKITTWEDYYYSKFSAMESALSKLNSQTSSMSGLFGN